VTLHCRYRSLLPAAHTAIDLVLVAAWIGHAVVVLNPESGRTLQRQAVIDEMTLLRMVEAGTLVVQKGAIFDGNCVMEGREGSARPVAGGQPASGA